IHLVQSRMDARDHSANGVKSHMESGQKRGNHTAKGIDELKGGPVASTLMWTQRCTDISDRSRADL
ncbi:MAG: hypothetical protein KJ876_08795, partial [Alphaproteobacteria bacterium]|nr:hypothetical protein [Alphaproteobacteria bacterium]